MDERDILRHWRELFSGKVTTSETLAKAESLLEGLSGESPLQIRLRGELEELKNGPTVAKKKRSARRQVT